VTSDVAFFKAQAPSSFAIAEGNDSETLKLQPSKLLVRGWIPVTRSVSRTSPQPPATDGVSGSAHRSAERLDQLDPGQIVRVGLGLGQNLGQPGRVFPRVEPADQRSPVLG
jgi:hypothetical protein